MSADEPLAPEPGRRPSPLGTTLLAAILAFLGGALLTGAIAWYMGAFGTRPAPVVAEPAPQPEPAPARALSPGTDIATLSAREQALAARLDQIELRINEADSGARDAASHATQAERLMIAFAARRAIERGQALGALELQLRRRFGEEHDDAVATIIGAAGQPVTLEDLRLALDTIGPRLIVAPDRGWLAGVRAMVSDMIVLRQADSPSPRPADRLKRARRVLNEGQVEAALAEVSHLPGVADAQSWVTAAKRYIGAREALLEIEVAAMDTPAAAGAAAGT